MQEINKKSFCLICGGNPLGFAIEGAVIATIGVLYQEYKDIQQKKDEERKKKEEEERKRKENLAIWYNDNPQYGYYPSF